MDPDHELVAAAAGGSREAFDELVRRHQGAIVNLARAMTPGSSDADDLAQESFVRAWRNLRSFKGQSTFRTWLHGIALNVVRSHHSRRRGLRDVLFGSTGRPDESGDPVERVASHDDLEAQIVVRQAIDQALAELPADLREAVILRDVQGLEYREIAAALGVPVGTVESRIFRGRQRLRPLLETVRSR